MTRTVVMIDAGGWGGTTQYTYNLMQALAGRQELRVVLVSDAAYETEHLPRRFELVKLSLQGQPYCRAISAVSDLVRALDPGLVHVQTLLTARRDWLWYFLARLTGRRLVHTCHNVLPHEDAEKNAPGMRPAFAGIYAAAHRIICHTQYSRQRLQALFGVPAEKIAVIPHGNYLFCAADPPDQRRARAALGLPQDKQIVMHFGALRRYKGIDILLEAFARVRERHSGALLLLAGKPMHMPAGEITQSIRRLGLERDVRLFPDYVALDRIGLYFSSADICVYPYREIDMSGSLQLAYAFARPVVASDTGGMAEAVEQGKSGLLVPAREPLFLSEALLALLEDAQRSREMGAYARRMAQERFSWEAIAARTLEVYREVLG